MHLQSCGEASVKKSHLELEGVHELYRNAPAFLQCKTLLLWDAKQTHDLPSMHTLFSVGINTSKSSGQSLEGDFYLQFTENRSLISASIISKQITSEVADTS